jgi:hypothetical protein
VVKTKDILTVTDDLRKAIILENKLKEEAKKITAVSRKQLAKCEMKVTLMRKDIAGMRHQVGFHVKQAYKDTQSQISSMSQLRSNRPQSPKTSRPTSPYHGFKSSSSIGKLKSSKSK